MDYKYIEQLLERYWNCETTLQEEEMLRVFFSQEEIPAHLMPYKSLFVYGHTLRQAHLSEAFDEKILNAIAQQDAPVKAREISMMQRLRPLYKAVAVVAIVLTLGNAAQHSFMQKDSHADYNYENYQDTYKDPEVAYDQITTALKMVSEGLNDSTLSDTVNLREAQQMRQTKKTQL